MTGAGGARTDPRRRRPLRLLGSALAAILLCAIFAPTSLGADEADRATAGAYLTAQYEYARSVAADARASVQALTTFDKTVEGECAGVLSGAPTFSNGALEGPVQSARTRGREAHLMRQLATIRLEIALAQIGAADAIDRKAREVLLANDESLRWHSTRIARTAAYEIARQREALTVTSVGSTLCSDLRAWSASGFRVLAPNTASLQEGLEPDRPPPPASSLETLLKPLESRRELALVRHTGSLLAQAGEPLAAALSGALTRALGLREPLAEEHETEVQAAQGQTASGEHFVVEVQLHARSHPLGCLQEASVSLSPPSRGGEQILVFSSGGGLSLCLRGPKAERGPRVTCEEGLLAIATTVPANVHMVRLQLSDGRTVKSSTEAIAAGEGGPARVYVQAVRGPSPIPVSLTELDARGRTVRVVSLAAVPGCRRPPPERPPVFATIVSATTPTGHGFSIEAISFPVPNPGRHESSVDVTLRGAPANGREQQIPVGDGLRSLHLASECPPNPYTIVFGIAAPPAARVLARTPIGLTALRRLAIPAQLRAKGALVFAVFPAAPSQLVLESSDGRVLRTIDLSHYAREGTEYCEGYAEG